MTIVYVGLKIALLLVVIGVLLQLVVLATNAFFEVLCRPQDELIPKSSV
jgi:hypothetical protein